MVSLPYRDTDLAIEVNQFAESLTPAEGRWMYCLGRVRHFVHVDGVRKPQFDERTSKVCDRIIGRSCHYSFRLLHDIGWEGAVARDTEQRERLNITMLPPRYSVGPLQPWHIGHVYFARVASHPHVLKIGFSRRVRDRLEDIESKCKVSLDVPKGHLKVGTLADEHWWHRDWKATRITGEWFFDHKSTDRTLPAFLQTQIERAA